ncbi:hypothetical protein PoMZ_10362 [Pyricularia oryzae]|uniref:Uncharacterized protein n=1 Tax=Pyricularia oryzae TaxID=318829 RepID=A0A4P7N3Z7_PYROR|nr:hypothetical protein PoMZ_10362 [Pyricularia oryzae]
MPRLIPQGRLLVDFCCHFATSLSLGPSSPESPLATDANGSTKHSLGLFDLNGILGGQNKALEKHLGRICLCRPGLWEKLLEDNRRVLALLSICSGIRPEQITQNVDGMLGTDRNWSTVGRESLRCYRVVKRGHRSHVFVASVVVLLVAFVCGYLKNSSFRPDGLVRRVVTAKVELIVVLTKLKTR